LKETSDWIAVEFKRISRNVVDPSGSTFINYA
jgi:Fic family protein